jgi:3-methylfumaryl-CoA hydratase
VTQEEGYPGLIVHGPLIATLLVDLVRQSNLGKKLKRFEFRAVRPTFDIHSMQVNASPDLATDSSGKTLSVWAQDHEGWLTMQAKAELV